MKTSKPQREKKTSLLPEDGALEAEPSTPQVGFSRGRAFFLLSQDWTEVAAPMGASHMHALRGEDEAFTGNELP